MTDQAVALVDWGVSRLLPMLEDDGEVFTALLEKWVGKLRRNQTRSMYYDLKQPLKDLGIAVPPQLRSLDIVMGWPAKGVNALARRCIFDGFTLPGSPSDPFGLDQVWDDNRMDLEVSQGITSALIHGVAFIVTGQGRRDEREPEIVQNIYSAHWATGIWDKRLREFSAALVVPHVDDVGLPDEFIIYLPDRVYDITRPAPGRFEVYWQPNPLGAVPVRPLVYQPELERPLGHSRISRAAMSLTDQAARVLLRAEVSAEFFSAPQRYLLGADEAAFEDAKGVRKSAWQAVTGRWLAIGRDEDGELPQVGQFPQQTMDPHLRHLTGLSEMFAAEMNLPVGSLGVVQDNPASAEAIYAAKEELVIEAQGANRAFGTGLVDAALDAVMLRDGLSEPTAEMRQLRAKFRNPATPSIASATDAVIKQIGAMPWFADSDVALEQMGYDETTVERLRADRRRAQAGQVFATIGQEAARATTIPAVAQAAGLRVPE
ncbi:phage portal protein [Gryllotalpicola protaetiae]|uniref:Phage portal protein n=1 Tax=Gryllotalpicola protaetiae TaxID=2419771 RepID=A0A387BMZ6_9MICO|nr:phage portal protein [Gryllotalpicola protaetiae]AYG02376.1 phage portal protein [Gryllotalpicola protaetiae]